MQNAVKLPTLTASLTNSTGRAPLALKHTRALPTLLHVFEELDLAVTLWNRTYWEELRERSDLSSLLGFELEHGAEFERTAYNLACLNRVVSERKAFVGEHGGFSDLFVPIVIGDEVDSVLVSGPFATARATSTDILERWRTITGRQGHPADPEFSHYLSITLSTLVLEGPSLGALRTFVECIAELIAEQLPAETLVKKAESVLPALMEPRMVERMWAAARLLVDERSSRMWASPHRRPRRTALGLTQFPEHAIVGLFVGRERDQDPVEELLLRDAFQRHCAELTRAAGNALCGQIGDHGIVLIGGGSSNAAGATATTKERSRRKLLELAERAAAVARKSFGLDVFLGVGSGTSSLSKGYQEALSAAESALSRGQRVVLATPDQPTKSPLGRLRRELTDLLEEEPQAVPARFDRYLEAVAVRSGHRLEPARLHLEAAFERITEAVLGSGAIEALAFASFSADLERAASEAVTVSELFSIYRRALVDLLATAADPNVARTDRSLRRAEAYMRRHYAEDLTLGRVAKAAGFAPAYFSVLFKKKQKITFARYLTELRVERAKQLLSRTELHLARVAELSGLSTPHYLCRVFKRVTGSTPEAHRRRTGALAVAGRQRVPARSRTRHA